MGKITVLEDKCKGCGLCVEFCPKKIIKLSQTQIKRDIIRQSSLMRQSV